MTPWKRIRREFTIRTLKTGKGTTFVDDFKMVEASPGYALYLGEGAYTDPDSACIEWVDGEYYHIMDGQRTLYVNGSIEVTEDGQYRSWTISEGSE